MNVKRQPVITSTSDGPRLTFVPESMSAAAGDRFTIGGQVYEVGYRTGADGRVRERLIGPAVRENRIQRPKSSTATKQPAQVQRPRSSTSTTKPTTVRRPTVVTARCLRCEVRKFHGNQTEVGTVQLRGDALHSTPCTVCGHRTPRDKMPRSR